VTEERKDICPICLQPVEPDDDAIQEGDRDVHVRCNQIENEIIGFNNPLKRSKDLQILTKSQKQEV